MVYLGYKSKEMKSIHIPSPEKYPSRRSWEETCWQKIPGEILKHFASRGERKNLILRIAVAQRLSEGKSYRKIAQEMFVSLQTINSVKKSMGKSDYLSYYDRGKADRRKKVFSAKIGIAISKRNFKRKRTKYGILNIPN